MTSDSWMEFANCRTTDPDLFFPGETNKWNLRSVRAAFKICSKCPVSAECLTWAVETRDIHAILGGTTPDDRFRKAALWKTGISRGCSGI